MTTTGESYRNFPLGRLDSTRAPCPLPTLKVNIIHIMRQTGTATFPEAAGYIASAPLQISVRPRPESGLAFFRTLVIFTKPCSAKKQTIVPFPSLCPRSASFTACFFAMWRPLSALRSFPMVTRMRRVCSPRPNGCSRWPLPRRCCWGHFSSGLRRPCGLCSHQGSFSACCPPFCWRRFP